MELTTFWFILIARPLDRLLRPRGLRLRRRHAAAARSAATTPTAACMINTIGPVWDGNEVWLLTAGGATFAAFPDWYATLFSGFYLPLFLILVALIVRGVAFEYRGKVDDAAWRGALGPRHRVRLVGARRAVGRGVRQHRAPACPSTPTADFTGTLLHPAQPVRPARRRRHRRAVRSARRRLPRAQDRGRDPRAGRGASPRCSAPVAVVAGGLFLVWNQLALRRATWTWLPVAGRRRRAGGRRRARPRGRRVRAGPSPAPASPSSPRWCSLFGSLFPDVMPSTHRPGVQPDRRQRHLHRLHADRS